MRPYFGPEQLTCEGADVLDGRPEAHCVNSSAAGKREWNCGVSWSP